MGRGRLAERPRVTTHGLIFVVARDRLGLYDYLRQHFSDTPEVRVILDRRQNDRRQHVASRRRERRRQQRRRQHVIDNYLRSLGYMIVRDSFN